MNEQMIFLYFVGSLTLLLIAVVYLILAPHRTTKEEVPADPYEAADKLLSEARMSAMKMVKEANYKALQTLHNANAFSREAKYELEDSVEHLTHKQLDEFEKLSQSLLDTYRQSVEKQRAVSTEVIESVSSEIKEKVYEEVKNMTEALQKETIESQEMAEQQIRKEYETLKSELEAYKASQYKKIDDNIYKIAINATQKILGRAVSLEENEKIVMDSLEEAKNEGVFN